MLDMSGNSSSFRVDVDRRGDVATLRMTGELDMAATEELKAAIGSAQANGTARIVFDLRDLEFLDSTGLGVLLEAHIAGSDGHAPVSFIRGVPTVHRVFELTKMDDRVEWVTTED
jgi:anti-anti-sigma factor